MERIGQFYASVSVLSVSILIEDARAVDLIWPWYLTRMISVHAYCVGQVTDLYQLSQIFRFIIDDETCAG